MDEILVKYLLGEASDADVLAVDQWLAKSEDNRRHFDQLKHIWVTSKQLAREHPVDVAAAWQQFETRIAQGAANPGPTPRRRTLTLARMAAAAVLILVVGIYFYTSRPVVLTAGQVVRTDTLPDMSVVTLNKHAAIRYHKSFNKKNRKLALEGEAFFDVTANKEKPFEIEVNEVQVKVVGTSFNVKSEGGQTEVIVETGIVQVLANGKSVAIHPGQKIVVNKGSAEMEVQANQSLLYNYYRTNELICNNTPLSQLVDALNDAYDSHIIIADPAVARRPITTRFKQGELDEILDVIAATLDVTVVRKQGTIIIQ